MHALPTIPIFHPTLILPSKIFSKRGDVIWESEPFNHPGPLRSRSCPPARQTHSCMQSRYSAPSDRDYKTQRADAGSLSYTRSRLKTARAHDHARARLLACLLNALYERSMTTINHTTTDDLFIEPPYCKTPRHEHNMGARPKFHLTTTNGSQGPQA